MKRIAFVAVALVFLSSGSAWCQKAVDRDEILKDPEWKSIYDKYVPDAGLVENLRAKAPTLKADVYFAFWCGDSKNHMPVFLKILDAINVPEFKVHFYAVEKKATADQQYFVEDMMVEKVPTFVFYANDFEMGRIVENPKNSLLQDMLIIVF